MCNTHPPRHTHVHADEYRERQSDAVFQTQQRYVADSKLRSRVLSVWKLFLLCFVAAFAHFMLSTDGQSAPMIVRLGHQIHSTDTTYDKVVGGNSESVENYLCYAKVCRHILLPSGGL